VDTHLQHVSELQQIRDSVEQLSAAILPHFMQVRNDCSEPALVKIMAILEDVRQLSQQAMREETRYVVSVSTKMVRLTAGTAPPTSGRAA
jgi:hypothetical protein